MKYGGKFNLRYDDTNPTKEEQEYVDSIRDDVRWLGADWEGREFYASDYFDQLYEWAEKLIQDGKAYVATCRPRRSRKYRGDIKGGKDSPYRNRSVEENLDLFRRMKAGEFPDGARTLRAKIDMSHAELPPARPDDVPHHAREAPPHRRQVVHLPDVRLRARRVGLDREASRTRSARWSSRSTARSTTGTSRPSASTTRSRSSSPG